ncbi:hypothetical protein [Kibdelosporangium philippinense]|uniref:hypothetical protein n=1 Tax=Kibdelosporangium philippinense TaxID=211113 RepID=UPI00361DE70D
MNVISESTDAAEISSSVTSIKASACARVEENSLPGKAAYTLDQAETSFSRMSGGRVRAVEFMQDNQASVVTYRWTDLGGDHAIPPS